MIMELVYVYYDIWIIDRRISYRYNIMRNILGNLGCIKKMKFKGLNNIVWDFIYIFF